MDVEEFLEHHGVKGQKWGVRRKKLHDFKKEHATGLKVAGGVAAAVAITAGAIYAKRFIAAKSTMRASAMGSHEFNAATKRLFDAHKGTQYNQLEAAHKSGRISREQGFKVAKLLERQAVTRGQKSTDFPNRLLGENPGIPRRNRLLERIVV